MSTISTTRVLAVAVYLSAAIVPIFTTTQSTSNGNDDPKESGLTWWQISLLVVGGLLVFTCWGCYFFFKHRENQQAKFKPVGSANGDDPRVRSNSDTVAMEPPQASPDNTGNVEDLQDPVEMRVENTQENTDTRIVPPDEIIIENINENQPMTSRSAYESKLSEMPAHERRGSSSRYAALDEEIDYQ
ncbi:uncharacterized protein LOC117123844 [Anneissia japonica]|uniref:uncharacterized protein LOC117123844 n=1 Tax=Anneissia japonica TaxID=1529436 RepID=UPI0014254FAE|nr:uncharacterized protein LOC117123844 [Anneissia japonica]